MDKRDLIKKVASLIRLATEKTFYVGSKISKNLLAELDGVPEVSAESIPADIVKAANDLAETSKAVAAAQEKFKNDPKITELEGKAAEIEKLIAARKVEIEPDFAKNVKTLTDLNKSLSNGVDRAGKAISRLGDLCIAFVGTRVTKKQVAEAFEARLNSELPGWKEYLDKNAKLDADAKAAGIKALKVMDAKAFDAAKGVEKKKTTPESELPKPEKPRSEREAPKSLFDKKPEQAPAAPAEQSEQPAASSNHRGWLTRKAVAEGEMAEVVNIMETVAEIYGEIAAKAEALAGELEEMLADSMSAEEFMASLSTEQQPAEAPAEAQEMELAEAAMDETLSRTAKVFPSEHDQSGNFLEMVEADGQKKLIVRKDIKSKISRKVSEHLSGAFSTGERVYVDFGDFITEGTVQSYEGEDMYAVCLEDGRTAKVQRENIFGVRGAKKLWE